MLLLMSVEFAIFCVVFFLSSVLLLCSRDVSRVAPNVFPNVCVCIPGTADSCLLLLLYVCMRGSDSGRGMFMLTFAYSVFSSDTSLDTVTLSPLTTIYRTGHLIRK